MALGYRLPSTIIYDNTKPASFNVSSSQRTPCFIGLASPYKTTTSESVVRGAIGVNDSLAYSSSGIYQMRSVGSLRGLGNFKENTHYQVVSNKISWLPKITNTESLIVADVLTPVAYNLTIDSPIGGLDSTSGYCQIGSTPTPFIGAAPHLIPAGTYSIRVAVDGGSPTVVSVVVVGGETWTQLVTALSSTLTGATASIVATKIKIVSTTTGSSSAISISDGITNGLLAAITLINEYKTSIGTPSNGTDATNGYSDIHYASAVYFTPTGLTGLSAGTYNIKLKIDAGVATDHPIVIAASGTTWNDLVNLISAISGVTASIVDGNIRIISNTLGSVSALIIADGTSTGLIAAMNISVSGIATFVVGSASANASIGLVDVTTTPTTIVGSSLSGIVAGTYTLNLNVNGGGVVTYSVTLLGTETWAQVASKLDTAIALVADAAISSGKLRISSKISGAISTVALTDGATNGFLAAIDAVVGSNTPNIESSVSGTNATSGAGTLSSTPEAFTSTKMCNLPSGVYTLKVTVDGGSSADKNITITGPTQTWSSVVTSLNSSLSGATASIVSNKIAVQSNSTGVSSTIVLANGTTNGVITALNNLTGTTITVQVNTAQYPRDIASTKIDFISGVTTYNFTLTSPIVDHATTATITGDAAGIEAIQSGSILNLSSVGVWLDTGSTYYASYDYNRPDSDFNVYKTFQDFNVLTSDLGENTPANDLVMAANLALTAYSVPNIGVIQIKSKTKTNFLNALEVIKYKDVDDVLALSTDPDVRSYVINHVNERSLAESKRNRMAYCGAPSGTPVGDELTPSSLRGIASSIKNERIVFVNATRGLYYYNDPITGVQNSTVVDGAFIACAVGAFRDSFSSPTTPLINKNISGITLFSEDYDSYYSEYMLTQSGASSCFLLAPSAAGGMVVWDDLTTDNSTVERNNINIITAKDYLSKDIAHQMDTVWKGSLIKNPTDYAAQVSSFLAKLMNTYLRNNVIAAVVTTSAVMDSVRKDTVIIFYSYNAVYTHKYTEGSFEIIV